MSPNTTPDPVITYREFLAKTAGPFALYLIEDRIDHAPHVSWLLKTDRSVIDELGPTPLIEFRIGAFQVGTVVVVAVLIRIGHTPTILESWINGYNLSRDGLHVIKLLQSQPDLTLHFFNEDSDEQRAIRVDNPSQAFFRRCYDQILSGLRWTMEEFDTAKETVCATYPSQSTLWDALHT